MIVCLVDRGPFGHLYAETFGDELIDEAMTLGRASSSFYGSGKLFECPSQPAGVLLAI